ncbi:thiamine ABC transporter ATP-binding protein [Aestuariispira insulae]|uniref:Thiamine transport system ATP-binding protein n=1 Tax=Aestuariispira insulae TaxID=1461337 RepID=A0A3D9HSP9_9PROT|nr:thiamine ABC transporter ATP-binding protein [Aestuariispira insulae]RED52524.1 thiamine transport system ATP-binding protein [Aestuariispira insulae]
MLEITALRFDYDAMQMAFDLSLGSGQCLALVGPSGGGKTTLLNLIAGFDRPLSGTIRFDGVDITALAPNERPVTMLFQENNLFPHLTAADNVGLGIHPGLKLTPSDRDKIDQALKQVGLDGLGGRKPGALSGGQRQRVAIARSLVRRRPLLLLDEPFSALDPGRRARMLDLIQALQRDSGLTVVMASHAPEDALRIADQCAFIRDGMILAFTPPSDILVEPADPAIRDYLG